MNGINETITHLNTMYRVFNEKLDAQLPEDIVFTLIPNRSRSKFLGWFAQSRWVHNSNKIHEINFAADFLNRAVSDIAETMIHEMTHLKNCMLGIKDCNAQQYHNRN